MQSPPKTPPESSHTYTQCTYPMPMPNAHKTPCVPLKPGHTIQIHHIHHLIPSPAAEAWAIPKHRSYSSSSASCSERESQAGLLVLQ
jgi:hypothetical protein